MTGVGFAQPKREAALGHEERQRQQGPADGIEMGDRVEGQAAEELGGPVTQPVRGERVGELVDREPHEQHDRDDDDDRDELFLGQAAPLDGSRVW